MSKTQLEIAQAHELEVLMQKIELMRQLSSTNGFFQYYFKNLNNYKTNTDCFNHCNDLYFELFGVYKYSSMQSFWSINHKNNKKS